eukprot:Blabericola_migrator_1__11644@NODE_700_length_6820_cov_37_868651_g509_i0_p3_GENE_NODE_700_length_6820_cov_37_868651_g509_i0NODE_700_length_6820_cov_37_868651_g509_i0_p3_ORF_typecomplete_len268_score44_05EFhand_7/PF13499_6/0_04EFhand_7/PF13499_6/0_0019EFhand_6/PF13405_6/3e03EFhand_6/PF13405_6/0_0023EFhand_1/PF00036_32/4_4e03EFhand_1/PF00036_32/0_023DUF1840/PF08895_11/2_4DUF1840/PF08895_11/44EFhand_5/PF13202_6/9_4e03EFhand_5/PF13202_6/0_081EFhand_8/PF13833_6/1_9e03EFhand_8/PF13833_6/0_28EFhand_8/P
MSFVVWSLLLEKYAVAAIVEFGVSRRHLRAMHEHIKAHKFSTQAAVWRFIIQRGRFNRSRQYASATLAGQKERLLEEFIRLPSHVQDPIKITFTTLCQYPSTMGRDELVPGVLMRDDVDEALRALGIGQDASNSGEISESLDDEKSCGPRASLDFFDEVVKKEEFETKSFLTFGDFAFVILSATDIGNSLKDPNEAEQLIVEDHDAFFNVIDTDRDGVILDEELIQAIRTLVPNISDNLVRELVTGVSLGRKEIQKKRFLHHLRRYQ